MTLGKTCKYCSRCEMIICQQNELEMELAAAFARRGPELLGREYFVFGTVQLKTWKAALGNDGGLARMDDLQSHTADFRSYSGLSVAGGGWYRGDEEPKPRPAFRPQLIPSAPPTP